MKQLSSTIDRLSRWLLFNWGILHILTCSFLLLFHVETTKYIIITFDLFYIITQQSHLKSCISLIDSEHIIYIYRLTIQFKLKEWTNVFFFYDMYSNSLTLDFSFDRSDELPLDVFEDIFANYENKK